MANRAVSVMTPVTNPDKADKVYLIDSSEGVNGSSYVEQSDLTGAIRITPDDDIQAKFDAASAGDVFILTGDHTVNTDIDIDTQGSIRIIGYGATITQGGTEKKTFNVTVNNVTIENIHFIGKGTETPWAGGSTSNNGVAGVYIDTCDSVYVRNCRFTNHAGGSVQMYGVCDDLEVSHNYMAGMGDGVIDPLDNGADAAINIGAQVSNKHGCRITNNYITGHCFGIFGAAGSWVASHNIIKDIPGQHGIYMNGMNDVTISNNVILETAYDGIKGAQLSGAADSNSVISITDNVVSGAGEHGITVAGITDGYYLNNVVISGNSVYDSCDGVNAAGDPLADAGSMAAIFVQRVKHCLIEGNRIYKSQMFGIWIRYAEASILNNRIEATQLNAICVYENTSIGAVTVNGLDVVDCPLNDHANTFQTGFYGRQALSTFNSADDGNTNLYIGNVTVRWEHDSANGTYPPLGCIYADTNSNIKVVGQITNELGVQTFYGSGDITQTDTTVFNVKDFGAVGNGTTSDTTAINMAISACGNGELYFPPGTYNITETLSFGASNARITINGSGATLYFGGATIANNTCLYFGAATSALPAQSGDEVAGNSAWDFASDPSLEVGDVIAVQNTTNASYSGHDNNYQKQEMFYVRKEATTAITTQAEALMDWAAADATWTKLPGISPTIKGDLTIRGRGRATDGDYCISFVNCTSPKIEGNIKCTYADIAPVQIKNSYNVSVQGLNIFKEQDNSPADDQGLLIENSHDVRISNCILHGTFNGVRAGGIGMCTGVHIHNCTLGSTLRWAAQFDGNVAWSTIKGCEVTNGVLLGANKNEVSGCTVGSETYSAHDCITLSELTGMSHVFVNNRFTGFASTEYGIYTGNTIGQYCTEGGTLVVDGLACETPAGADAGIMLYFRTDATGPTAAVSYDIRNVRCTGYGTASNYGLYIYHSAGTQPKTVIAEDCHFPGAVIIYNIADQVRLDNVVVENTEVTAFSITEVDGSISCTRCRVSDAGGDATDYGFNLGGDSTTFCDLIEVRDCVVTGSHVTTIYVDHTSLCIVDGVDVTSTPSSKFIHAVSSDVAELRVRNCYIGAPSNMTMTGTKHYLDVEGTGDPSATLPASVGSSYRRRDGGAGTTLYIKESADDATGWAGM